VATGPGVHLHHRGAGGPDALGVVGSRLVALDHRQRSGLERANGALEQAGLAAARRAHQVERHHAVSLEPGGVLAGERVVLRQHARLELDVLMVVRLVVMRLVRVRMAVARAVRVHMLPMVVAAADCAHR
jgi:hypothetical protein